MAQSAKLVKRTHKNSKQKSLGTAPNDIYSLEDELKQITQQEEHKKQCSKYVECTDIEYAKAVLTTGANVQYNLPRDISPLQIIHIAKSLGLATTKLKKVLGSSMIFKKVIDCYVKSISSNKEYNGYLKHCTQVTALTCNNQLIPRVRIKMDLDYSKYYTNGDSFIEKFTEELCGNVFKCSADNIQIVQVREGSVIAIVAIYVAAIAFAGIISYGIHLCRNSRKRGNDNGNICGGENQEFHLGQRVLVTKRKKSYPGTVVTPLSLNKNDEKVVKIRYGKEKPSLFQKEEEFSLSDQSLEALEPGQDPSVEGSVHINEKGAYILANKKKTWFW